MEPNNIENQIREKLNSREIQPSAQAWDRLDAMLTVGEEKKTKRSFFSFKYIGIAASVLVFVTLGLFFFNQKNTTIETQNTVVETERKETPNSNIQTPNLESRQIEEVAVSVKKEDYSQQTTDNRQPITNNNEVSIINQNQEEAIVNQEITSTKTEEKVIKKTSMVDVDELLASVEKDRKKETKVNKSNINIDAKSLLSEVDTELDMTFRQRVLNTVNKNYKSVKEAVVNRNH